MALDQFTVVNYTKVGTATKAVGADGTKVYRWSSGKVNINGNVIEVSRLALSSGDDPVKTEINFNEVIDKFGASTPEELVDYWFENDFFLVDPSAPVETKSEPENLKIEEVGDISYFAWAPPGSSESDPVWKAMRLDETASGNTTGRRAWADGAKYTQVATDLTLLTYN